MLRKAVQYPHRLMCLNTWSAAGQAIWESCAIPQRYRFAAGSRSLWQGFGALDPEPTSHALSACSLPMMPFNQPASHSSQAYSSMIDNIPTQEL